jgi:hypothetical protein
MMSGMGLAYQISKSKRAAWIFGMLYVFVPYILVLERIGMRDSAMTFVFLSSLLGIFMWRQSNQLRGLIFSGAVLSLGIWVKSIAWLCVLGSLALMVMLKRKLQIRELIAIGAPLVASVAALYFLGAMSSITQKNSIFFIDSWPTMFQIRDNAYQAMLWLYDYLTPLLFIILFFLIAGMALNKNRALRELVLVVSIPLMIEIIIAEIFFPRYFLITVGGFLVILALYLEKLSRKVSWMHFAVALSVLLVLPAAKSVQFAVNPLRSSLPQIEQWQYISGWPAGYGVEAAADYLVQNPVDYIYTEESDLLRTGLSYHQSSLKSQTRVIYGEFTRDALAAAGLNQELMQKKRVVMALHLRQELPPILEGEKLFSVQKPNNGDYISMYRITGLN